MAHLTQLNSKAEYDACIKSATGKSVLLAYWPEDALSNKVVAALRSQLPSSDYAQHNVVDVYCFDVYALPELGTELDVTFVPTLMWFMDGIMDAIVWHEGVAVEGESVEKGIKRVVDRIKRAEVGKDDEEEEADSDDDW
jgi:hypothetical protein